MAAFNIKENLPCHLLILATIYTEIQTLLVFVLENNVTWK